MPAGEQACCACCAAPAGWGRQVAQPVSRQCGTEAASQYGNWLDAAKEQLAWPVTGRSSRCSCSNCSLGGEGGGGEGGEGGAGPGGLGGGGGLGPARQGGWEGGAKVVSWSSAAEQHATWALVLGATVLLRACTGGIPTPQPLPGPQLAPTGPSGQLSRGGLKLATPQAGALNEVKLAGRQCRLNGG